jgi:IMP dehydrogenase/GMP reductase
MRRLRKVQQIHKYHRKEEIVQINGIIDCTKNHEFYIMRARKGYWMPAAQLKLIAATSGTGTFHGWSLLDCRNELLMPLDSVTFKFYEGHVYDLSVEEDFSYNVFNIACHNSMCTTRINTGFGVPQVTAIMECCRVADQFNIPVIADGGVRYPGDVVKAIGLGSSAVMLGNLLAGTDESPGSLKRLGSFGQETLVKTYRGSASLESKLARGEEGKNVEGVATLVSYKGSVDNVLTALTDGLRSGMSYAGAMSIPEFWARAKFVRVTNAGVVEASPHGQNKVAKI